MLPTVPVIHIDQGSKQPFAILAELWTRRYLIWALVRRDVLSRYSQTILGVAWVLLRPLLTTLFFTLLLTTLFGSQHLPTIKGVPYALSTFCALLPWQLFARTLMGVTLSLSSASQIITRVYFPRLVLPLASAVGAWVDLCILLVALLVFAMCTGVELRPVLMVIPVLMGLTTLTALGIGLWLAPLNALFRDVQNALGFVLQLGMLATPVVYTRAHFAKGLSPLANMFFNLNPMVHVCEGFRWAVLHGQEPNWHMLALSGGCVALLLVGGLLFFIRLESVVVDKI